ncbi:MAG: M20 family metallopeptidase [Chloroflexi bacterium]|nr:M20 family metallopeptidase [Chloroflexota bacterium]
MALQANPETAGAGASDAVRLCSDLVRIRSFNPPGDEAQVANYCAQYLEGLGFEVRCLSHSDTRASVLARLPGTGEKPGLLICSHIDTVPVGVEAWQHDPFGGEIVDGKLYGRGASDMKGGLSAALAAVKTIVNRPEPLKGDLWMGMTAGEEVDFLGAREIARYRDELLPLQAILLPEPSDNKVYIAQKGALWLEVTFFGKTAHGSMPLHGVNAVLLAVEFLNRLHQLAIPFTAHPLLGEFTLAPTMIKGGMKTNVIPDSCSVTIDMRTVPGQSSDAILDQVGRLVNEITGETPGASSVVRVLNNFDAVTTPADHPIVSAFCRAASRVTGSQPAVAGVNFFTDSAVLTPALNVPMLICGPGKDELAHQPNEYVEVACLETCARIYSEAILEYLG